MANEDQLTLLKRDGIAAWNRWRQHHPEVEIDLSEADLRHLNLSGVNFREANLSQADLSGAILDDADFTGANAAGCLGYPQITSDLLLDDPLLIAAFEQGEMSLTERGTRDSC